MSTEPPRPAFNDRETYAVIGAALEVHREIGCGFGEGVYREALSMELLARGIPFAREVRLPVEYKGEVLPVSYRIDFLCYGSLLVEIKALGGLGPDEQAQVISYLHAARRQRALLLNFGTTSLQHRRIVRHSVDDPARQE